MKQLIFCYPSIVIFKVLVNYMKYLLILVLFFNFLSPIFAQQTGVLYLKKVKNKFGWFEKGNDKIDWKYSGEIKNGKQEGVWEYFYYNGNLETKTRFIKGVKNGMNEDYHEDGYLEIRTPYKNGLRHGTRSYFSPSGERTITEEWKNDESVPGTVKTYY